MTDSLVAVVAWSGRALVQPGAIGKRRPVILARDPLVDVTVILSITWGTGGEPSDQVCCEKRSGSGAQARRTRRGHRTVHAVQYVGVSRIRRQIWIKASRAKHRFIVYVDGREQRTAT